MAVALQELSYRDDADLVSMHACLFDDIDAQTVLRRKPADWLERNWRTILKRAKEYHQKHRVWLHPGKLFMLCVDLA